jgi:hypothetical protein
MVFSGAFLLAFAVPMPLKQIRFGISNFLASSRLARSSSAMRE